MGLADGWQALIDEAYAAAFDRVGWAAWADRLAQKLGGSASVLAVMEADTGELPFLHFGGFSARTHDDYAAEMSALDPQKPFVRSATRSLVYRDSDHLDYANPDTARYMRWSDSVAGMHAHLGALIPLDRHRIGLVSHWKVDEGPVPAEAREVMQALLPSVRAALELGFRHAAKLRHAYWEAMLDQQSEPAALVGASGALLRATPGLERLIRAGDGLVIRSGRLHALVPADDAAMTALIGQAAGSAGEAGAVRITRRSGKAAYVVAAHPLPPAAGELVPDRGAAALITVIDPLAGGSEVDALYAGAFALTRRESELAGLLMLGHSIESAGAQLGIATATGRIHLRQLFAKTGTARQADLVRLLARIAATRIGAAR